MWAPTALVLVAAAALQGAQGVAASASLRLRDDRSDLGNTADTARAAKLGDASLHLAASHSARDLLEDATTIGDDSLHVHAAHASGGRGLLEDIVVETGDRIRRLRAAHAGLMVASWGVLIPLGIIAAATTRSWGGYWFHAHRALNSAGLLVALAGALIAWTQFSSLEETDTHHRLGTPVMVVGFLQPINAFFRPHAPDASKGEEKSRKRFWWSVFHRAVGYAVLALALATIFTGFDRGRDFRVYTTDAWQNAYTAVFLTLFVIAVALFAVNFWNRRRQARRAPKATGADGALASGATEAASTTEHSKELAGDAPAV